MTRALLFHDVVSPGDHGASGFVSPDANIYKFTAPEFQQYLLAFRQRGMTAAPSVLRTSQDSSAFLLTFDDGGVGALHHTAAMLEAFGHVGHFFITTDYIGAPGFLSADQIRELARRGHVIGSHSCSHPTLMSHCSSAQLEREWSESVATLSSILGEPVTVASVPGGSYSREVGRTAAAAGIRFLFTSEPTTRIGRIGNCALIGRFSVQQGTSLATAAALGAGDRWPRFKLFAYWNFKKILKHGGGKAWLRFRRAVLARRQSQ